MHTNFSQATHQSTLSPNIGITLTNTSESSSEIQRGEAKNQTQMQTTKTQYKETDVKALAKDSLKLKGVVNKVGDAVDNLKTSIGHIETFIDDVKEVFGKKGDKTL